MSGFTIEHIDQLSASPALVLAAEGWLELLRSYAIPEMHAFSWDDHAFIARTPAMGRPCAVLSYSHMKWKDCLFITMGYVQPVVRRLGIYRMLWDALIDKAQEMSVRRVEGVTHKENAQMRSVAERLGRRCTTLTYEFQVTPR